MSGVRWTEVALLLILVFIIAIVAFVLSGESDIGPHFQEFSNYITFTIDHPVDGRQVFCVRSDGGLSCDWNASG